jgi:hypothetical protein
MDIEDVRAYITKDPSNVVQFEYGVHHAPQYMKSLDGSVKNSIQYEYPADTPSVADTQIRMVCVDFNTALQNAQEISGVSIDQSPFKERPENDTVIPSGWAFVMKRSDGCNQYVVQYENGELGVYDEDSDSYFFPPEEKVIDRLSSGHRIPILETPISGSLYEF